MTAGSRSACASSIRRCRDGVAGTSHKTSSLVRATPIGVPKPGS
jgi:hypothetical protein